MIKLINLLELGINANNITPKMVYEYYFDNVREMLERDTIDEWEEYKELCRFYCQKYHIPLCLSDLFEFERLSQQDLNKFYKGMKQLVQKHTQLNELGINKGITAEEVKNYYIEYINVGEYNNIFIKYIELCKPYCEKYNINKWISYTEFKQLSQQDLNKLYLGMKNLVNK